MGALELEELVIAAARAVRIAAADPGPRLVGAAAPRLLVEEHADAVEDPVLLVAQHAGLFLRVDLGEARRGLGE